MEITRDHKVAVAQWLRKNTEMTLAQMGEVLGVTDRTISRFLADFYDGKIGKVAKFFDTVNLKFKDGNEAKAADSKAKDNYRLVITNKTITVIKNGTPRSADKTHRLYAEIDKAAAKKDYALAYELINSKSGVKVFADGLVEVYEGNTIFNGVQIKGDIGKKIAQMVAEGKEDVAGSIANFLVRVFKNPDDNMPERLFAFCSYNDIKITPDGMVETYKIVNHNFTDCYTGTMDNSVGRTVVMDRKNVNGNPDETCSYGLHVCSIGYLGSSNYGDARGGNRILLCLVDPADFVAVPRDYNNRKARVCQYKVLADVTGRGRTILGIDPVTDATPLTVKMDRRALAIENGKLSEDEDEEEES